IFVEKSRRRKAMAELRLLHGLLDIGIVDFRIAAIRLQIAIGLQATAELHNGPVDHPAANVDHGQWAHASAGNDIGILLDCFLGGRDVLLGESREAPFRLGLLLPGSLPVAGGLVPAIARLVESEPIVEPATLRTGLEWAYCNHEDSY